MENPRFFLYGRGSEWGIGHLSQICAYARGIKKVMPQSDVIIASGSKLTHYLVQLLPQSVEFIKLPLVRASGLKDYKLSSERLKMPVEDIFSMRKDILYRIFTHFKPHVIVVDNAFLGSKGELRPILEMIHSQRKQRNTRFPIRIFCPQPTGKMTHSIEDRNRDHDEIVRRLGKNPITDNYDYFFINIPTEIYWHNYVIPRQWWPKSILERTFYPGYVSNYDGEKFLKDAKIKCKIGLKSKEKLIVVACGGGRDGFEVMKSYIEVHSSIKESVKSILFPGIYMSKEEIKHLQRLMQKKKNLYIETFKEGTDFSLADWMHAADLFIGMGGLNTLAEVLTTRVRAIIIPRHPKIEEEQFIHSSILKEKNLIEMIDPDRVNKDALLKAIQNNLHLGKLKKEETSYMINGSIKAAKKIKALIRCH